MKRYLYQTCFILIFCFFQANAQDFWEQTSGPEGAYVNALAVDANGHILAGTQLGLYRSENDGESWAKITEGIPAGIVLAIAVNFNGDIFIGAGSNQIYRSIDNGTTWTEVYLHDSPIWHIVINATNQLFAGTFRGILRSTDNGDTWVSANNGLPQLNRQIHSLSFNSVGHIFAASDSGVFRSTDNGENWIPMNNGLSTLMTRTVLVNSNDTIFVGTNSEGVFRSTDGGNSWNPANNGLSYDAVYTLALNSAEHIFASTPIGIFKSINSGETWTPLSPVPLNLLARAFAFNADDHIFIGTTGGISRSVDNGSTWIRRNNGIIQTTVQSLAHNSEDHVFAATLLSGLFRSTDDGNNWVPINNGLTDPRVTSFAFSSTGDVFAGSFTGIFRSPDNGDSWTAINNGLPANTFIHSLEVSPGTPETIFAGTRWNGIYRSNNNGNNWMPANNGLTNPVIYSLSTDLSGNLFAGSDSGIFRSTNNGNNWSFVGLPDVKVYSMKVNSNNEIFAGVNNSPNDVNIYRSLDNGTTWDPVSHPFPLVSRPRIVINSNNDIYVNYSNGIIFSQDNGETWTTINSGFPAGMPGYFFLSINAADRIFVGTELWGVYRSINSTVSVQPISSSSPRYFYLEQNYPNPFNPRTTIKFHLTHPTKVSLKIFNVLGEYVETLLSTSLPAGTFEVEWNAVNFPSGSYFYQIEAGEHIQTKKLTLIK